MPLSNDLFQQATGGAKSTDLQPAGTAALGSKLYFSRIDHAHPGSDAVATDFVAGLVGTPGFSGASDSDTGIYLPAANTLGIVAGGEEAHRFLVAVGTGVNFLTSAGSAAGAPVITSSDGTDSDIGINIAPKGTGKVSLGTAGVANGALVLNQGTSGATTITPAATGTNAITLPSGTRTLATLDGTETLTNKTITGSISTNTVRASASVTANATTTYATVTGLTATVVPGTYEFVLYLPSTVASGTGGIKYAFHYTTTVVSALEATSRGFTASAVAVQHTTTTTDVADLYTSATVTIFTEITGTMVVGTGGTIDVQMAQNTSNASNTVALLGGTATFKRIA